LKPFEKESFLKSILLYFITIELLVGFLLYHSYHEDIDKLRQRLFLEMKNYNFDFKGDKFDIDFVPKSPSQKLLELRETPEELYVLFPLHGNDKYSLKIFYERQKFEAQKKALLREYLLSILLLTLITGAISFGFAWYTLRPLRRALALLDDFIKDIIHDLNTPVSAIMVNLSMLPKELKAAQRIRKSAETIGMLHRNLRDYHENLPQHKECFDLRPLLEERTGFFRTLYPALTFDVTAEPQRILANEDTLTRILDNLLSNACKYNTGSGTVTVELRNGRLRIENSVHLPIRRPERLFERFYRENERGIGIGLHIVKRLCDESGIGISLEQSQGRVAFTLDLSVVDCP